MKNIFKNKLTASNLYLCLLALTIGYSLQACKKTDSDSGMPIVNFVRITAENASDSLVTHAFMGKTVAIIGDNLQDVNEIWFNDQKAFLNTSFITSSSIILEIPNVIPSKVSNMMYLVKKNKVDTLKYAFGVDVPPPMLSSMLCEYVEDGKTAIIKGNFFIDDAKVPLKVFFAGNLEGKVKKISLKEIEVTVPVGASPGALIVKNIYGSSRSSFYFRDDRGIILDFDGKNTGNAWRNGKTQNANPVGVMGNYCALKANLTADFAWVEDDVEIQLMGKNAGRPEGGLFKGDVSKMALKFEANVVNVWTGGWMQFIFHPYTDATNSELADDKLARGMWRPWTDAGKFSTDGWITVTIPLTDFKYNTRATVSDLKLISDNFGSLTVWVYGPVPSPCNIFIGIDNIRVVPM